MRKAAIPALIVIIFLAFGIILAAVVIYWALNKFIEMAQGKCWADADKAADQIKSDLKAASGENKKITMGDCAGGIIIFNKKEIFDDQGNVINNGLATGFSEVIKERCTNPTSSTIKSYILVIPYKTLADEAKKNTGFWTSFSEWITHPYLSFKQVWEQGRQYIVRIKPICKTMDIEVDNSQLDYYCIPTGLCNPSDLSSLKMDILKKGSISYCYTPSRIGSSPPYAYSMVGLAECTK